MRTKRTFNYYRPNAGREIRGKEKVLRGRMCVCVFLQRKGKMRVRLSVCVCTKLQADWVFRRVVLEIVDLLTA